MKEAIDKAKDGDTINIAPGEYKGEKNTHNLVIRKNLNFIKYGDGEAIFNGENQKRIWFIGGSAENRLYLNIRGLTFINGKSSGDAGAIYFNYAGGSITDCTFTNCTTSFDSNVFGGGAIYFRKVAATITNCTFTNNAASQYGGAVNFDINGCNVTNCTFIKTLQISVGVQFIFIVRLMQLIVLSLTTPQSMVVQFIVIMVVL